MTTLLDSRCHPARHLAALYRERWEIEVVFAELKTYQRGAKVVFSSKTPDGVLQQIWAHLLAHRALRELMARTAATRELDSYRISFTETLRSAWRSVTLTPGGFSPSSWSEHCRYCREIYWEDSFPPDGSAASSAWSSARCPPTGSNGLSTTHGRSPPHRPPSRPQHTTPTRRPVT
ncbi:transposase [Streptomyces sp. MMBL 11-3]|uniref:transposase n=1 Tax=Streptomyces sp. MMBL 11-3 TaxID=3382639 RepID=UPI0039B5AA2A